METLWRAALWPQFGATLDMLDNALAACPDTPWRERLWPIPPDQPPTSPFSEFWFIAYHTLFWLNLYLTALPENEFAPPAPFAWAERDDQWVPPEQPYTKAQLRDYLAALCQMAQATLAPLTEEQARRPFAFPWKPEHPISYLELQLYNMRHAQEHAAQLSLLLGRHGVPGEALDWVSRARGGDGAWW